MDGPDRNLLQQELVHRPVGAVLFSRDRFQTADAAPYDGLAAVVVPVNTPVKLTAVSAIFVTFFKGSPSFPYVYTSL